MPQTDLWLAALRTPLCHRAADAISPEQILRFRLYQAIQAMYGNTEDRNALGRDLAEPEITEADLVDMYIAQEGLWKYTKVPLRVTGPFKFSAERLLNDVGYIHGNVVLTIAEVNGPAKWTEAIADKFWP